MTSNRSISVATPLRCYCRIDDSPLRQWVTAYLRDSDQSVEFVDENPHLAIYDGKYGNILHQDLSSGRLKGATVLLCLRDHVCDSYLDLFRLNVRHIIYPASPFATEALRLAVDFIRQTTDDPGQHDETITDQEHYLVQTAQDYETMQKNLLSFLQTNDCEHMADNASMVLREALTNAIFHSFRETGSHARKYDPEIFLGLYDNDTVDVTFKATPQWLTVKVRDNSGGLGPLSVANSLDRQRSEQGLHDTRGRGFYLMRHMSHRMIIRLDRGVETVVELYFLRKDPGPYRRHLELLEK